MSNNYGEISEGIVVRAIVASISYIERLSNPSDWVIMPEGVGVGWSHNGSDFTGPNGDAPPPPLVTENYTLSGSQWVERFTESEWSWLKTQRATSDTLDQLMDALRWADIIDVSSTEWDGFYAWILDNGLVGGQVRVDELRGPI